jgi:hypothetical protein
LRAIDGAHVGVEGVERDASGAGGRLPGDDAGAAPHVQRQRPAQQRPARSRGTRDQRPLFEVERREEAGSGRCAYLLGSVAHEEAGADSLSERSHAA